eukprot:COSAG01_NODE_2879_length_6922_cov_7.777810_9_plen_199_part_00
MGNVWKGDTTCVHSHFKNCTANEVGDLNSYMASFLEDMGRTPTFTKPGNGAFVESCLEHCGEQTGSNFDGYQLNGTTMQEAHSRWWSADEAEPAAAHTCVACDDMMLQLPPQKSRGWGRCCTFVAQEAEAAAMRCWPGVSACRWHCTALTRVHCVLLRATACACAAAARPAFRYLPGCELSTGAGPGGTHQCNPSCSL